VVERVPYAVLWQAALLLPHPVLTLLYLLAVRAERVEPSFAPVTVLATLPVLSAMVSISHLRGASAAGSRGRQMALLALAALEVAFSALAAAVVGFAIGLRSL
jgi:hypothetical protein